MTVMKDHYKTLGIQKGASEEEIKKAYRQLARVYHPDKNDAPDAEERFKQIGGAYEVLKCKERRDVYNWDFDREKERHQAGERSTNKSGDSKNGRYRTSSFANFASSTQRTGSARGGERTGSGPADGKKPPKSKSTDRKNGGKNRRRFSYAFEKNNAKFTFSYEENANDSSPDEEIKTNQKNKSKSAAGDSPWKRRYSFNKPSYTGRPLWEDEETGLPPGSDTNGGFEFNFGFRFFMDGKQGFAFSPGADLPGFSFDDYSDDEPDVDRVERERRESNQQKADQFAQHNGGESIWYDWSRPFFDTGEDLDWKDSEILMTCTYCGRQMKSEMMLKHEPRCRRFSTGSIDFEMPRRSSGVRRQEHEDFINLMRQCRKTPPNNNEKNARKSANANNNPSQTFSTSSLNSDLIMCQYCYRKFNVKVAGKHIQFCQRKMKENGRPMNPLGKTAEARDYCSKNYTAREYAKTIPKPGSAKSRHHRNKNSQPNIDDMEGDEGQNGAAGSEYGPTEAPNNINQSDGAAQPTRTGLYPTRTRKTSIGSNPGSRLFSTRTKPTQIDVNAQPFASCRRASDGNPVFSGAACQHCVNQYGGNVARFACSCGLKKSVNIDPNDNLL
ncbi:uncharacterized protein LOC141907003 isoform X2 [Tubulanus polymorphus]|uniref:uncharacterized protein LOC141907003 isoform X2 n=1 Tax=Tubulanus polymorphus TaxID=672921 RepID=UPI003DA5FA79